MGLLQKLFRKEEAEQEAPEVPAECSHASLVARWDDPDDIGKEDRASSWVCTSCNETFTPAERQQFIAAEAERVRQYQEEKAALARQQELEEQPPEKPAG